MRRIENKIKENEDSINFLAKLMILFYITLAFVIVVLVYSLVN